MAPFSNWSEIAALISAAVALAALATTYYLARIQIDPDVIVYATKDIAISGFPHHIVLVIENIGRGLAVDVSFDLSEHLYMWDYNERSPGIIMDYGPLIDGIPNLAPGQKRFIDWGHLRRIQRQIGNRNIIVKCKFKSPRRLGVFHALEEYSNECILEIKSFLGGPESIRGPSMRALQDIARSLQVISKRNKEEV